MSQYTVKDTIVHKELFLDNRFIDEMSGLVRNFCEPVKCPDNPIIRADCPHVFPRSNIEEAFALIEERPAEVGKVVIKVGDNNGQ